jgi:hypothetical protein
MSNYRRATRDYGIGRTDADADSDPDADKPRTTHQLTTSRSVKFHAISGIANKKDRHLLDPHVKGLKDKMSVSFFAATPLKPTAVS